MAGPDHEQIVAARRADPRRPPILTCNISLIIAPTRRQCTSVPSAQWLRGQPLAAGGLARTRLNRFCRLPFLIQAADTCAQSFPPSVDVDCRAFPQSDTLPRSAKALEFSTGILTPARHVVMLTQLCICRAREQPFCRAAVADRPLIRCKYNL